MEDDMTQMDPGLQDLGNQEAAPAAPDATLAKLMPGAAMAINTANSFTNDRIAEHKKQAVSQIAQAMNSGDTRKAIALYAQVDPQGFQKILPHLSSLDPTLAQKTEFAKESGKQAALQQYGQTATDVQDSRRKANASMPSKGGDFKDIALEDENGVGTTVRFNKKTGEVQNLDGSPVDPNTLKNATKAYAPKVKTNKNTGDYEAVSGSAKQVHQLSSPGAAVEQTPDGKTIALTPNQNNDLKSATKDFNKDKTTQDLIGQIRSGDQASGMVKSNVPGSQAVEMLRILRSVTARPAVQEFMAMKGWQQQGVKTALQSWASSTEGKGMGKQQQANMLKMIDNLKEFAIKEYDQHLDSFASQVSENSKSGTSKVDSSIVKQRLNTVAPTTVQQAYKDADQAATQIGQLPSEQKAAAFNALPENVKHILRARYKHNVKK